jgi:hypothetical protein
VAGKRTYNQVLVLNAMIVQNVETIDVNDELGANGPEIHHWNQALTARKYSSPSSAL